MVFFRKPEQSRQNWQGTVSKDLNSWKVAADDEYYDDGWPSAPRMQAELIEQLCVVRILSLED